MNGQLDCFPQLPWVQDLNSPPHIFYNLLLVTEGTKPQILHCESNVSLETPYSKVLDKREMFGYQTTSNIVWGTNILPFGHFVWCCLILFDRIWSCLIKFECHQTFDQKRKILVLFASLMGNIMFVFDSRKSNMFDVRMRTTFSQWLVSVVSSVFDQICLNRLATHFNSSMFGHQTMFDCVWSQNICRLSRP